MQLSKRHTTRRARARPLTPTKKAAKVCCHILYQNCSLTPIKNAAKVCCLTPSDTRTLSETLEGALPLTKLVGESMMNNKIIKAL